MAVVIVDDKVLEKDFQRAKEDYQSYIKITIDIGRRVVALGGEFHANAEEVLLQNGSLQENIWGGGINLETKQFETNAILNLKPGKNESTEILNSQIREKFLAIAKEVLEKYV